MTVPEFVAIWEEWDRRPSDYITAGTMEDACQHVAGRLGIPCSDLRDRLSERREQGEPRADALKAVMQEARG